MVEEADHERITISLNPDHQRDQDPPSILFRSTAVDYELFEQRKEEYGFKHKSAAARYFLNIGMHSIVENDPRNSKPEAEEDGSHNESGIEKFVPEGKENALNIRDGEVIEALENNILELVDNNPELTRDGLEVYK